ncbi:MAG: extracellular solute-binding protein, partial [Acidimicrobiales bacterium]
MRTRRVTGGLAMGLAAAVGLAACGSGSPPASSPTTAAASPSGSSTTSGSSGSSTSKPTSGQTITYWASVEGTGTAQTTKTLKAEFATFTKQTGIHVNMQVVPWSSLLKKILTSVTSGQGPDVMEIGNTWSPSLGASGGFVSFTPSVFSKIGGRSKFSSAALKVAGQPGKPPMSVPVYSEAYALFYNKADFKAAGISGPPKTWTQLVADGQKLTTNGR